MLDITMATAARAFAPLQPRTYGFLIFQHKDSLVPLAIIGLRRGLCRSVCTASIYTHTSPRPNSLLLLVRHTVASIEQCTAADHKKASVYGYRASSQRSTIIYRRTKYADSTVLYICFGDEDEASSSFSGLVYIPRGPLCPRQSSRKLCKLTKLLVRNIYIYMYRFLYSLYIMLLSTLCLHRLYILVWFKSLLFLVIAYKHVANIITLHSCI